IAIEAKGVSDRAVAGDEFRAVFRMEFANLQFRRDAEAIEQLVVVRKERLADLEARKFLALQQEHVESALAQQRCRGRAGRAAADHDDIAHLGRHAILTKVSCSRDSSPWRRKRPDRPPSSRQPAGGSPRAANCSRARSKLRPEFAPASSCRCNSRIPSTSSPRFW